MSILERLSYDNNRVLNVTLSKDKRSVELEEACDMYFKADLNKQEFGLFIDELKAIYEQMPDS